MSGSWHSLRDNKERDGFSKLKLSIKPFRIQILTWGSIDSLKIFISDTDKDLASIGVYFNSNLIKARKIAREKGANIVKVTEKKTPDLWSSCYRIKVDFYFSEKDITKIPQYQLQIN